MVTDRRTREDDLVRMISCFRILVAILTALITSGGAGPAVASGGDDELALNTEERQQIERGLRELTGRLGILRRGERRGAEVRPDRLADAEVFAKGIAWALQYDATFARPDRELL